MAYALYYQEIPDLARQLVRAKKTPEGKWILEHKLMTELERTILDEFCGHKQGDNRDRLWYAKKMSKSAAFVERFGSQTPETINTLCFEVLARFGVFPKKDSLTPRLVKIRSTWERKWTRHKSGEPDEDLEVSGVEVVEIVAPVAIAEQSQVQRNIDDDAEMERLLRVEQGDAKSTPVAPVREDPPLVLAVMAVVEGLYREHAQAEEGSGLEARLIAAQTTYEGFVAAEGHLWEEVEESSLKMDQARRDNDEFVKRSVTDMGLDQLDIRGKIEEATARLFTFRDAKMEALRKLGELKPQIAHAQQEVIALEAGVQIGAENYAEKMHELEADIAVLEAACVTLRRRSSALKDALVVVVPLAGDGGPFRFTPEWTQEINSCRLEVFFDKPDEAAVIAEFSRTHHCDTAGVFEAALNNDPAVVNGAPAVFKALQAFFASHSDEQGRFSPAKLSDQMKRVCAQTFRALVRT